MKLRASWHETSLMRQLLLWSLGALVLVWGCFVFLAYRTGIEEADELTDGQLASVAVLLLGIQGLPSTEQTPELLRLRQEGLRNHDYQQSLSVLVWNAQGQLRWRTGDAPPLAFDASEGYATVVTGQEQSTWRSFSQWNQESTQKVAVLLLLEERDALAQDIAGQMIEPGLWLLPVVALALGLAIARGLKPLLDLSEEVAALDVQSADSLVARHPVREFDSVVTSINTLLGRQKQALHRERLLASEIAHELRTPLTSIVLQVQALEADPALQAQSAALARIRSDTLRAGHVLNQLLTLARSSHGGQQAPFHTVDIAELARTIAADYAQAAWERHNSIEVQAPTPACISGQLVLLDMAVRNLVENALRHTPPGTRISVQCGADPDEALCPVWLQVCDDGQRSAVTAEPPPADSLHLGHAIVARVADAHGAVFSKIPAPSPYTTCYRLAFPASTSDTLG